MASSLGSIHESEKGLLNQLRGPPLIILSICLVGSAFCNFDQSLFGFVIPSIRTYFKASLGDVGWILSASFAFACLITPLIGAASDRYGRRMLFALTLGGSSMLVGLQSFAPTIAALGVIRILAFGLSNGLGPVIASFVIEASPARLRGVLMGVLSCGYPLGWLLGSGTTVLLLDSMGWRSVFLPAFAITLLAGVLVFWLPESKSFIKAKQNVEEPKKNFLSNVGELFQPPLRRRTLTCVVFNFMFGAAYSSTAFYFPTFFSEVRGYSAIDSTKLVGMAYGVAAIGYLGSALVGEFVFTRRTTVITWLTLGSIAMAVLLWVPRTYNQDVACFAVMGCFFYGTLGCTSALFGELFPTRVRATSNAITSTLPMYTGFAIFPLVVPLLVSSIGWQWAFTVCAVPTQLLAALTLFAIPSHRSGQSLEALNA